MKITQQEPNNFYIANNKNKDNFCLVSGIVTRRENKMDNVDMKRPTLYMEIVRITGNEICFDEIPLLFSDYSISKTISGYKSGDILTVSGVLAHDENVGVYINVDAIDKLHQPEKLKSIPYARATLLKKPHLFNLCILDGITEDSSHIKIKRRSLFKGDLKKEDNIPIFYKEDVQPNKPIQIIGYLGKDTKTGNVIVYTQDQYIKEKQNK